MIPQLHPLPRFGAVLIDEVQRTHFIPQKISFELTEDDKTRLKNFTDEKSDRFISLELHEEKKSINGTWKQTYSVTQSGREIGKQHIEEFIPLIEQAALSTKTKGLFIEHLRKYAEFKNFKITV